MAFNVNFNKDYFERNKKRLIWIANKWYAKWLLGLNRLPKELKGKKIIDITPNSISYNYKKGKVTTAFFTRPRFAEALAFNLSPFAYLKNNTQTKFQWKFSPIGVMSMLLMGLAGHPVFIGVTIEYYTEAGDGYCYEHGTSWYDVQRESISDVADYTTGYTTTPKDGYSDPEYHITRQFYPIDTSAIPDTASISSVILNIKYLLAGGAGGKEYAVCNTSQASTSSLITDDYNEVLDTTPPFNGSTPGSDRVTISNATAEYKQFTFNSTGLAWVTKTGITKIGVLSDADWDADTSPFANIGIYFSEETGTSSDPYLSVTYTVGTSLNPSDWGRKCSVTIDNTKVSGITDLTDLPVLLTEDNLPSEMFDADGSYPANSDGSDIRFTSDSAGTNEIPLEIVNFTTDNDPANGEAEIWVKVPTVSTSSDTVIYVWYNNSSAVAYSANETYGSQNVWNSNYKGVWHMNEDPSGTAPQVTDSTSNANNGTSAGTMTSGDLVTGKVGNAIDFDGTDDMIETDDDTIGNGWSYSTQSFWVKSSDTAGYLMSKNNGWQENLQFDIDSATSKIYARVRNTSTSVYAEVGTSTNICDGNWHRLDSVWDGSTLKTYLDGTYTGNSASITGTMVTYTEPLEFAGRGSNNDQYLSGILDDIRILNSALSSDWIATEYNNQNSPSTFATEGTPESTGTAYTQTITDTTTLVDGYANKAEKILSDSAALIDNLIFMTTKVINNAIIVVDSIVNKLIANQTIQEALTLVETVTATITAKILNEITALSEVVKKVLNRINTEAITLTDSISKTIVYIRELAEQLNPADTISRVAGKVITNATALADSIGIKKSLGKVFNEITTLVETTATVLQKTFSDIISVVDSVTTEATLGKIINEAISIAERFKSKLNGLNTKYVSKYTSRAKTFINKYIK